MRVVAVASLMVLAVGCFGDDDDDGLSASNDRAARCQLEIKVLSVLAGELALHHTVQEGLSAADAFSTPICNGVLAQLARNTTTPVSFQLITPTGTIPETLTLDGLLKPPPTPPRDDGMERTERFLDCFSTYHFSFGYQLCIDGVIEPQPSS